MKIKREFTHPIHAMCHLRALSRLAGIADGSKTARTGAKLTALLLPGYTLDHRDLRTVYAVGRKATHTVTLSALFSAS